MAKKKRSLSPVDEVTVKVHSLDDEGQPIVLRASVPETQLVGNLCRSFEQRMAIDGVLFHLRGEGDPVELDRTKTWAQYTPTSGTVYMVDADYDPMG